MSILKISKSYTKQINALFNQLIDQIYIYSYKITMGKNHKFFKVFVHNKTLNNIQPFKCL